MINQLSQNISDWLQSVLTPDKMQSVQDFITDNFNRVAHHKLDLYFGYIGIKPGSGQLTRSIFDIFSSPMPDVWTETTGKAVEQFIKAMGG
jgi:ABC-type enterochelin transport system permease subunit